MRFLADENLHSDIVRWLRSSRHDVSYVAEGSPGDTDASVLQRCRDEARVLVTDDKDFGDLVVRRRLSAPGVLLLRLRTPSVPERITRLGAVWQSVEPGLRGRLVVVSDRRVRSRPLDAAGR